MVVQLNLIKEEQLGGEKWVSFFDRVWPFYKQWFLSEGYLKRKGYLTSSLKFEKYMPELVPAYEALCESVGGEDLKSRFLSMYCPPAYMSGCSQIAWTKHQPSLIRNYDYHPRFFDGTVFYSNFLKPVIGMSDCAWGLLDGINADGLAVSLTFGGSKTMGNGFGIPVVVRYVLETCATVQEATEALRSVPVHMAYNLTLLDAKANYVTVYMAPEQAAVFVNEKMVTNHQGFVEWDEYATFTKTLERKDYLEACNASLNDVPENIVSLFLKPPLYHTNFEKAFGTLYTSSYNTQTKGVTYAWPRKRIHLDFNDFTERKVQVNLKNLIPKHI